MRLSSCGISGAATGVVGGENSVVSSPISARVEEGVAVPEPPLSGREFSTNEAGLPAPREVAGEEERDV